MVTVLLSRRMYSPLADRLLHDRTADKMARVISRIPGASAQILAYDIGSRVAQAIRAGDTAEAWSFSRHQRKDAGHHPGELTFSLPAGMR